MKAQILKLTAILLIIAGSFYSCKGNEPQEQDSQISDLSFTPCKQTQQSKTRDNNELSGVVNVEFTSNGVHIMYYNFEVACDFNTVDVNYTFVNGFLNITQQGTPNEANCVCYTDVSYTINGISQNEVNVIFINGEQVYCYNKNYPIEISFEEYSLAGTSCQWTKLINTDECDINNLIVINSDEELDNYISCTGVRPVIDFTNKTLILVSGVCCYGISNSSVKNLMQLKHKFYELEVELTLNVFCTHTPWQMAIIIDKIDAASMVNLKISYIEATLNGNWVNDQKDTLEFFLKKSLAYKSHIPTQLRVDYFYEIMGDSISLLWLGSSYDIGVKYYFKRNCTQIEMHNFQNVEYDIYKLLE